MLGNRFKVSSHHGSKVWGGLRGQKFILTFIVDPIQTRPAMSISDRPPEGGESCISESIYFGAPRSTEQNVNRTILNGMFFTVKYSRETSYFACTT